MNTLIDDNIKKLLYEKGWRYDLSTQGHRVKHSLGEARFNDGNFCYVDISIAEVVMWLYEKYDVWIFTKKVDSFFQSYVQTKRGKDNWFSKLHNLPTKSYLEAIVHTLNSLI